MGLVQPKSGLHHSSAQGREAVQQVQGLTSQVAQVGGTEHGGAVQGVDTEDAGIDTALAEAGMTRDDIYLDCGDCFEDFGQAAALRLRDLGCQITAIFAGDDDIAAGVLLAVRQRGWHVPHDISIMGFDDNFHARHLTPTPTLTTIRQPIGRAGELAADLLLAIIAGKSPALTDIRIPTELLRRDSVRDLGAWCRPRQT